MKVQRLSSTDGFIIWDIEDATTSVGVVRTAPKVLQDGAVLLARATTYAFAVFGIDGHAGASAGVNAKPDDREEALRAFAEEVRPAADDGRLRLFPGLGATATELPGLGWEEPDPALLVTGAVAAAGALGALGGRSAAVVGSGPVATEAAAQLDKAGASVVAPRFDAECDVLFVAGKAGVLDHDTAASVKAPAVVPLSPVPVTARALALLGRAGCVVVPDFVSTAAPMLAGYAPGAIDPAQRIREATLDLGGEGTGLWLAAARRAEDHLATWTKEKPFGRPLA